MTDETTKTREQELMEEFDAGLDAAGATALQLRIDALIAENKTLDGELGLDEQEQIDLEAQADKLQKDLDAATERADGLQVALDAANAKVADAEAKAKAARSSVSHGARPAKPRKIAVVGDGLTGGELAEALAKAGTDEKLVEIVLADGVRELAGVAPIVVSGDVWREHTLGRMLRDPVTIHGPAVGQSGFVIHGYALLIDGKPVAYCTRSDPITVAPGTTISIADDIYF